MTFTKPAAKALVAAMAALATGVVLTTQAAGQEIVTSFAPLSSPGVWFENDVRAGGAASTVDLTGLGGDLELNQPLPIGAALLTTGFDSADKVEVGVANTYGQAGDILSTLELTYAYHKASNAGQNAFAAPSIKLAFFAPAASCTDPASGGDCFGTLVYEPTWNQPGSEGSSVAVPTDTWTTVNIDETNGLFWWTGGFGAPNTAGGPPLRTLADWAAVFSSDFASADLVLVSVGVGTSNQGQIGYFDDVQIFHAFGGGFFRDYDFEPQIGPPLDKDECKNGGWMVFNTPVFRNQGDCVSFVATGGEPRHNM